MLELHVLVAVVKQPLVDFLWSKYGPYMTALASHSPGLFVAGRPSLDSNACAGRLLIRDRFLRRQFEQYLQYLVRHCPDAETSRDLVDWVLLSAAEHEMLRAGGKLDMNGRLSESIHKKCAEDFVTFLGNLGAWQSVLEASAPVMALIDAHATANANPAAAVPADGDAVGADADASDEKKNVRKRGGLAALDRRRRRLVSTNGD